MPNVTFSVFEELGAGNSLMVTARDDYRTLGTAELDTRREGSLTLAAWSLHSATASDLRMTEQQVGDNIYAAVRRAGRSLDEYQAAEGLLARLALMLNMQMTEQSVTVVSGSEVTWCGWRIRGDRVALLIDDTLRGEAWTLRQAIDAGLMVRYTLAAGDERLARVARAQALLGEATPLAQAVEASCTGSSPRAEAQAYLRGWADNFIDELVEECRYMYPDAMYRDGTLTLGSWSIEEERTELAEVISGVETGELDSLAAALTALYDGGLTPVCGDLPQEPALRRAVIATADERTATGGMEPGTAAIVELLAAQE
ncbi:hypothetical protein HMPREF3130_08290 [Corynebacterium sp. HMSC14B06]|uniref:hypothetical protein n=1 Tax=Corynebacterium sp. HMSC14B06 TaxID=1581098 RepID=UPI0008A48BD0|nr:hypothetical protein [Corynebacterium sp. HMSC14B06]OFT69490.1 hypothetical protein HMPREF3130_08290 [Corynebacterium sp. HMSC14B06]